MSQEASSELVVCGTYHPPKLTPEEEEEWTGRFFCSTRGHDLWTFLRPQRHHMCTNTAQHMRQCLCEIWADTADALDELIQLGMPVKIHETGVFYGKYTN